MCENCEEECRFRVTTKCGECGREFQFQTSRHVELIGKPGYYKNVTEYLLNDEIVGIAISKASKETNNKLDSKMYCIDCYDIIRVRLSIEEEESSLK